MKQDQDLQWEKVKSIFGGYIKGQALVALCLACLYGAGFFLTPLKYAGFVVGVVAGFLSFVPYLGSAFALIGGLLAYALMTSMGMLGFEWSGLFSIVGVFFVVQVFEAFYLAPKIVGKKVGLGFFTSLIALLIGGATLGIAGVILAIPVAAIIKMLVKKEKSSAEEISVTPSRSHEAPMKNITPPKGSEEDL